MHKISHSFGLWLPGNQTRFKSNHALSDDKFIGKSEIKGADLNDIQG